MIAYARQQAAFVCTNDKLRDHIRNRDLGFSRRATWSSFTEQQRFGFEFDLTSQTSMELLLSHFEDTSWQQDWGKDHKEEKKAVWVKKRAPKVKGVLSTEYAASDEVVEGDGEAADDILPEREWQELPFDCTYSTGTKAMLCLPEEMLPAKFLPTPSDRMVECLEMYKKESLGVDLKEAAGSNGVPIA